MSGEYRCSTCHHEKKADAFGVRTGHRGRSKQCKECVCRVQKAWTKRHRKPVPRTEEQWIGHGKWNGSGVELLHYEKHQTLNPATLAEWAGVCKGFRVVIRELLVELDRKDYTVKECKRCGKIREHSPKGRRCRDCWREFDRQREIDYKAGFTRPRLPAARSTDGKFKRVYVRKEQADE